MSSTPQTGQNFTGSLSAGDRISDALLPASSTHVSVNFGTKFAGVKRAEVRNLFPTLGSAGESASRNVASGRPPHGARTVT
jgi:hypothetical protein